MAAITSGENRQLTLFDFISALFLHKYDKKSGFFHVLFFLCNFE